MEHRCPKCDCTRYIESGQARGTYELYLSDHKDEMDRIERSEVNADAYSVREYPNKYVMCCKCGKKYKPTED